MLIYLIIYIPFVFCAYYDFVNTSEKKKDNILWFWVIVFTLFRGLRWEIGTDWAQFLEVYNHAHWDNIFSYYRNEKGMLMDYGYMFINAFFHETGFSYTSFLIVTNFWIMWCYKDFCYRHTNYPILSFILIMSMGLPFPVRQTIAFATSLWACRYMVEKKWVLFFLVLFAAAMIHKGSFAGVVLIALPFILERWHIKWWVYAIVYASSYVIANVWSDYISTIMLSLAGADNQLGVYSDAYLMNESLSVDYGDYNVSILNGLSYTLFFITLLWIREKYETICKQRIKYFEVFFFMYALVESLRNLVRQSEQSGMTEVLGRVIGTFDMFPLVFPLIFILLLPKYIKSRELCFLIFFMYMLYKFWQQIPASFYHQVFIPYKSVLGL